MWSWSQPQLSFPGRVVERQIAVPTPRVATTAVQGAHFEDCWSRESWRFFIALLLGHFNHSDTKKWPIRGQSSLYLWGLCRFSSLGCRGAFISRVSLWLGTQLPGCRLEAVHLWDMPSPSTWRQDCGKKPLVAPKSAFALTEALSAGVPVLEWQWHGASETLDSLQIMESIAFNLFLLLWYACWGWGQRISFHIVCFSG